MDSFRKLGLWRDQTVLDDLRAAVLRHGDREAIVGWHADGRSPERITYTQLAAAVDRYAAGLLGLGVRRGNVVTLQLPNNGQFAALVLACARIGAVAGPVAPVMRRREVEFITRLTESPVYIGLARWRNFSYAQMSAEIAEAVPSLEHRVLLGTADLAVDDPARAGALDLEADLFDSRWLDELAPGRLDELEAGPDDPAQIMFTSGTTGEPKGVMHSHNTLYATNRGQIESLGLGPDEITAMGSPLTLQGGYTWNFLMPLLLGGTSVQVDVFKPDLMLRIIEVERVSFFYGAPTVLNDLIQEQRRTHRDLDALRVFGTGSAPVPPVWVEQAVSEFDCRVYAVWGMTENGCTTVTRPEDPSMRAAESDGTPVPGMQVRIVDTNRRAVPAGESGRLQVRGANQCLGYYRRPELYAATVTADGWFDTGDLARDDGYGGIRITGRNKDLISRGGLKIPALEIEAVLLRHPAVADVAVIGYADQRLGERACAVVVPAGAPPTLGDLTAHLSELGMAKPYWPERLQIVDGLPKTPSGKVQKFMLREQLTEVG